MLNSISTKVRKNKWLKVLLLIVILVYAVMQEMPEETTEVTEVTSELGELKLIMFDVGQADSCLIQQGEDYILIDCATSGEADGVIKRLQELGVKRLKYLIVTHPHDDHGGGASKIVSYFTDENEKLNIDQIYAPYYTQSNITTNWHDEMLATIIGSNNADEAYVSCYEEWEKQTEGLSKKEQERYLSQKTEEFLTQNNYWKHPEVGEVIQLGNAEIQFIAPNAKKYSNLNNYSIGVRVTYGEIDALLTGDAEILAEKEILANGLNIQSEVLKIGHHGSNTSTSQEFLDAVNPQYVLISCELGHKDSNPDEEVVQKLEQGNYIVRRTDENGEIIMTTDGKNITWNCEPGDYLSGKELKEKENAK